MNQQTDAFTPEEQIKNEIELIKLKLEIEHGAIIRASPQDFLSPEMELKWYNEIMNYERLCMEAGYTTIHDFIGSPNYPPCETLQPEEVEPKLKELVEYMCQHGIGFESTVNEYSPAILYKFITEELFQEEICRYRDPEDEGLILFSYEDFYPNHASDLQEAAEQIMEYLIGENPGDLRWLEFTHEEWIMLNQKRYTLHDYTEKINQFKTQYPSFLFGERKTENIQFDLETKEGKVSGQLYMKEYTIPFTFHFRYDLLWWVYGMEMELIN